MAINRTTVSFTDADREALKTLEEKTSRGTTNLLRLLLRNAYQEYLETGKLP